MSVIGVVLLALGIVAYVEFCCSWKGMWKVVFALYAMGCGVVILGVEHEWIWGWMMK